MMQYLHRIRKAFSTVDSLFSIAEVRCKPFSSISAKFIAWEFSKQGRMVYYINAFLKSTNKEPMMSPLSIQAIHWPIYQLQTYINISEDIKKMAKII